MRCLLAAPDVMDNSRHHVTAALCLDPAGSVGGHYTHTHARTGWIKNARHLRVAFNIAPTLWHLQSARDSIALQFCACNSKHIYLVAHFKSNGD